MHTTLERYGRISKEFELKLSKIDHLLRWLDTLDQEIKYREGRKLVFSEKCLLLIGVMKSKWVWLMAHPLPNLLLFFLMRALVQHQGWRRIAGFKALRRQQKDCIHFLPKRTVRSLWAGPEEAVRIHCSKQIEFLRFKNCNSLLKAPILSKMVNTICHAQVSSNAQIGDEGTQRKYVPVA